MKADGKAGGATFTGPVAATRSYPPARHSISRRFLARKFRWQASCLADDYRRARNRIRRWWQGDTGRHGGWQDYNTGQMARIEADLATRPWLLEPAPALPGTIPPAPGPELFHHDLERVADDSFIAGIADALLRATSPHVYAPHRDYWTYAWSTFDEDFAETRAWDDAEANQLRAECGLGPRRELLALPAVA